MDYMQEDPYSSHRFAPHDPYYSGGGGGGGGYDGNYANNTSFDRQSDHSIHSDRNRPVKNYQDIPNGAPYGSSSNLRQSQSDLMMRASPQPPREGSYAGSRSSFQGPPGGDPHHSGNYADPYPQEVPRYNGGVHYPDDPYGRPQAELDYGYQGDPQYLDQGGGGGGGGGGSLYGDQPSYHDEQPSYHADQPSYHGDQPSYHGDQPSYHGDQPSFHDDQPHSFHDDQRYHPEQVSYGAGTPHQDDFRDDHQNLSLQDPRDDPYNDESTYPKRQNTSFHEPQDSYQGQALPGSDPYGHGGSGGGPPSLQYDPYGEQDRYSDAPRERRSFDQPGGDPYYPEHVPQPNDSFRQGDNYLDDSQRRFEGLPPVRSDPFGDDPFREQSSRDGDRLGPPEDPYYRGGSPAGGPDPAQYEDRAPPYDDRGPPYDDRGPPYDDRGPPYDDRGPPYDDRGPPYDDRDGPDPYSQSAPRYPSDYPQDYPEQDAARRLEQLNLRAAPPLNEGRKTPSVDGRMVAQMSSGMPVRYPDLQEVIDYLGSHDDSIKASAAAHMQHITYMDDAVKAKARSLGGIRPLVRLLTHEKIEVHKNACGALQNLSYGKSNNDNKRAIKNEGGIPELIRVLRKSEQEDVKESVTGVLWNLSSCEDLKQSIIDDGLSVLVNSVILRYSGFSAMGGPSSQLPWTAVCRNTTGVLRNVSSAGFDARKRLRESRGLVNALIYMLKLAADDLGSNDIDNKVVENTVCILRNLSYRIQEVVDPDFYKKRTLPRQQTPQGKGKNTKGGSEAGCFGNKSAKAKNAQTKSGNQINNPPPQLPPSSTEYRSLWGPEIHSLYSTVLKRCTNPITMEAAAGAIQNLTACDWQPAVESRALVRKEKGLPLLVDLLSAESDRVVCATATALRNLAIDEKNKELVGKYAIRQLVSRLPRDLRNNMPDDTICAVVATLYEVVKDNQDFAMALIQEDGLPRLMHINNSEGRYLSRTLKFTQTLLKTLWGYKSLHTEYAKLSYGQSDFTTSKAYPRQDGSRPPDLTRTPTSSSQTTPYNTLSRPMSGQGYDDSTLTPARSQQQQQQRGGYYGNHRGASEAEAYRAMNRSNASLHDSRDHHNYSKDRIQEDVLMNDLGPGYAPLDEPRPHQNKPPVGGVPLFPNLAPADPPHQYGEPQMGGEPVYAQVNKGSRRRPDQYDPSGSPSMHRQNVDGAGGGADSWV